MATPSPSSLNPNDNHYNSIIAFDIASILISTSLVSLRLYVRHTLVKNIRWDDWLLLAGAVVFSASCVLDAGSWFVLKDQGVISGGPYSSLLSSIDEFLYVVQSLFVRAAYTIFYLKIIPAQLGFRVHRTIIIVAFGLFATYITGYGLLSLFKCGSPSNLANPDAICLNDSIQGILFDVAYCCDAILDWTLALVPMDVVRKTVHSKKTKASIISILALGCVASCLAIIIPPLDQLSALNTNGAEDLSKAIIVDILATCEALIAIICLSLAATKPLFVRCLESITTNKSSQQSSEASTLPTMLPNFSLDTKLHSIVGKKPSGAVTINIVEQTCDT